MKIAAILVPFAILLLPVFANIPLAISHAIKGRDTSRSLADTTRKKALVLVCTYVLAFAASLSWSVYVFSNNIWICIVIGLLLIIICSIGILMVSRNVSKLSKPSQERYPDSKTEIDALKKREDVILAQSNIFPKWLKKYFKFVVLPLLIVLIILIILGIIAATS